MKQKLSAENGCKHCICDALFELKELQDLINDLQSKYYGQLLLKIVGVDTIPFLLIKSNGDHLSLIDIEKQFETKCFRIESIDEVNCCGTISLLRAFDFEGFDTDSIDEVVRLEKTSIIRMIDLKCFSAIQLLNPNLLCEKIIIEPK